VSDAGSSPAAADPADPALAEGPTCVLDGGEPGAHGTHACPHDGAAPVAPAGGDPHHFGAPFAAAEALALASALERAGATPPSDPVRVTGTIDKVCQAKGCWLVLKDGERTARVLMAGHAFTVPMDSAGRRAEVEGTLTSRTFTPAQAKHLAEDGGEDPAAVQGPTTEWVLTARGVRIESTRS